MRLLKRNTTAFDYRAYAGKDERFRGGMHTGVMKTEYADPVQYRGNISVPSGTAAPNMFGLNVQYTHILLMDDVNADIRENGLIDWRGDTYEITAVRPSLNVLAVALRRRTKNAAADRSAW